MTLVFALIASAGLGLALWLILSNKHVRRFVAQAWAEWRNPPYRTRVVQGQLPSTLVDRVLYVVEEDGYQEQAAMLCPCGCGRTLHLNLLPDERPCWQLSRHDDGSSSLHPSVWRQKDCHSHFWFKHGRVNWVGDTSLPISH